MNLNEIVRKIIQGCGSGVTLQLATEAIRQASVAAQSFHELSNSDVPQTTWRHASGQASTHFFHLTADALRGRVTGIRTARSPVNLVELSEICLSAKSIFNYVQVRAKLIGSDLGATVYTLRNVLNEVSRCG
jgi:hypothetical protein